MLAHAVITDPDHFDALLPEWEALLERSSSNEASVAPVWQKTWWNVFGPSEGRRLRIVTFRDRDGQLVGIAPLLSRRHWYRPGIPLRRLELLASGEQQADEICSDYNGLIVEKGKEPAVARALVAALSSPALRAWDELVLPAMSADDPLVELLAAELRAGGHAVTIEPRSTSPFIALPCSWEQYLASLSSSTRHMVKKTQRDLDAWAGGEVTFARARTNEELEVGFGILTALHGERWGSTDAGYGGVFASEKFRAFHLQLMRQLLERGCLELCWLSARGEPIAALYNFVWNNKVYHYQSGRRLDLPKQVRAGIAIHSYAIRSAIEDGRREYDFLPGDSRYKEQLALGQRQLVELRATHRPLLEVARQLARRSIESARAMQHSLRQVLEVPVEVW